MAGLWGQVCAPALPTVQAKLSLSPSSFPSSLFHSRLAFLPLGCVTPNREKEPRFLGQICLPGKPPDLRDGNPEKFQTGDSHSSSRDFVPLGPSSLPSPFPTPHPDCSFGNSGSFGLGVGKAGRRGPLDTPLPALQP